MIGMAKRNLKLFFRDKSAVFFSLLAVFIIIGLYALFLGDVWTGSMEGMPEVRVLMDSWILSGLLAVTSVTTTMGAFGTMVDDKAKNITKDFSSSPIGRGRLAGGYILSSFIVGVIMTLVALVLVQGYILIEGGAFLGVIPLFKVIGLVLLTTFTNLPRTVPRLVFPQLQRLCHGEHHFGNSYRLRYRHLSAGGTAARRGRMDR